VGSGGSELSLELQFDAQSLTRRRVPVGVDRWVAEGTPLARGGCSMGAAPSAWPALATLGLLSLLVRRRRTRHILTR
jgi:MYXO-CTERM domain-containing protein